MSPEPVAVAKNKWVNSDFLVLFEERVIHVHPSPVSPLLSILDGQRTHKGFQGIKFSRNDNAHMLSTRPQDSAQNVYESVYELSYTETCLLWIIGNPDFVVSEYGIAGFVNETFIKVRKLGFMRKDNPVE